MLFAELFLEIVIRRLYGYFVLGGAVKSPPDSLVSVLHVCVYMYVIVHLCTVDLPLTCTCMHSLVPRPSLFFTLFFFVFTILHGSGRGVKSGRLSCE